MFSNIMPQKTKKRRLKVPEAVELLTQEEADKLVDMEAVVREAIRRVEQTGIISSTKLTRLPAVTTPRVRTSRAKACSVTSCPWSRAARSIPNTAWSAPTTCCLSPRAPSTPPKPSDLIPEFQGRFPIRVELDALNQHDFIRILTEPKNALLTQYSALLATENVTLAFVADAVEEIARIAAIVNERTENIGARRLHTVVERLVEDLSFDAPELDGQEVTINARVVRDKLEEIVKDEDLSRYIL